MKILKTKEGIEIVRKLSAQGMKTVDMQKWFRDNGYTTSRGSDVNHTRIWKLKNLGKKSDVQVIEYNTDTKQKSKTVPKAKNTDKMIFLYGTTAQIAAIYKELR